MRLVKAIFEETGQTLDEAIPLLDARLSDGTTVNIDDISIETQFLNNGQISHTVEADDDSDARPGVRDPSRPRRARDARPD